MNFPRRPKDPNPPREEKASRDYYRECHPSVPTSQHPCVTRFPSLMVAHAHEKSFQARRHNFLDLCSKIKTATRKHHRRSQIDRRSKSYFSPFLLPALHLVEPNSPPASPDRLLPRVTARKFRFLIRFARPLARNGQVSPDERRAEER